MKGYTLLQASRVYGVGEKLGSQMCWRDCILLAYIALVLYVKKAGFIHVSFGKRSNWLFRLDILFTVSKLGVSSFLKGEL